MKRNRESREDYLEYILMIERRQKDIRSIDIVNETGYSKPSISRAVHLLEESGDIILGQDGLIHLTPQGREAAETIYERHQILAHYFMEIGVQEKVAYEDACRVEHIISEETFQKIKSRTKNKHIN